MRRKKSQIYWIWITFVIFSCCINNWALVVLLSLSGALCLSFPQKMYSSKTVILSLVLPFVVGILDFLFPNVISIQTQPIILGLLAVLSMVLFRYYSLICPKIVFILGVLFAFLQIEAFMISLFFINHNWTFIIEGAVIGVVFIIEICVNQKKEAKGLPFVFSKRDQISYPATIDEHTNIQLFSDFSMTKLLCLFSVILFATLMTFLIKNIYVNLGMINIFLYGTMLFRGNEVNYLMVLDESEVLLIKYDKIGHNIESVNSSLRYLNGRKKVIMNRIKYTLYPHFKKISVNEWKEFCSIINASNTK